MAVVSNVYNAYRIASAIWDAILCFGFSFNKLGGISYEKLCHSIPKSLGSRSSIQNLLNEGLDKKLFVKVESEKDKRIKNYFLSDDYYHMVLDWIKTQKKIYNS